MLLINITSNGKLIQFDWKIKVSKIIFLTEKN